MAVHRWAHRLAGQGDAGGEKKQRSRRDNVCAAGRELSLDSNNIPGWKSAGGRGNWAVDGPVAGRGDSAGKKANVPLWESVSISEQNHSRE